MSGASQIQLFGKVHCTESDYWVAQGVLNQSEEDASKADQEKRGEGVNATVFWVCHNLMSDWIQLPDVQPEHIVASRFIKKLLSGNLSAEVVSCPPFPGKERHLLRAQLARIQHATQICHKDLYVADDENEGQYKLNEEPPAMATDEMKDLANWAHLHPIILKAGRCTHAEPVGMGDEEKEEYMNKLNEEDKVEDRFKVVAEDTPVPGTEGPWSSKVCGDAQQYNKIGGEGTSSYAVNVVRSNRWPGAVTVCKGGQVCNIYIGNLVKRGDSCFNPIEPPEVQKDPLEGEEQPEPNGSDPKPPAAEGEEAAAEDE